MHPFRWAFLSAMSFFVIAAGCGTPCCHVGTSVPQASAKADRDVLYQISTLQALLAGTYDGVETVGDLEDRGDFGIGTFHRLDGEMVMLDGVVYKVGMDGVPVPMPRGETTPFADVTWFDVDETANPPASLDYEGFKHWLDEGLSSENLPYAVRVRGVFSRIKTRSVPAQDKPYPPLAEVVKKQAVFEKSGVAGTLVGFRLPDYMKGINVPAYHLHFLADDRSMGGHVLDFRLAEGVAEVDVTPRLFLSLPTAGGFAGADLSTDRSKAMHEVEADTKK